MFPPIWQPKYRSFCLAFGKRRVPFRGGTTDWWKRRSEHGCSLIFSECLSLPFSAQFLFYLCPGPQDYGNVGGYNLTHDRL